MSKGVNRPSEPLAVGQSSGLRMEGATATYPFYGHENIAEGVKEDKNGSGSVPHIQTHTPPDNNNVHHQPRYHYSASDDEEYSLDHQIRMLEVKQTIAMSRKWANPGPVGLLGFGTTTILLNLHNTGHYPLTTAVVAMGVCVGGGAQIIAGLLEWAHNNTFAFVAFTAYGAFWLSLVCVWMLPSTATSLSPMVQPASADTVGAYLLLWGIFTFTMLLGALRTNVPLFLVFLTLTVLFLMLASGNLANNTAVLRAAGYEGILCGSLALYLAVAEVLNEVWNRRILPVTPMAQVLSFGLRCCQGR